MRKTGQPEGQQQILQNAHVPGDDLAFDLAFPGHRRDVELRSVGEADRFQNPGEAANVPRKSLRPDFFIEVQARVGVEDIRGISGAHHQGQQPDSECPVEIEFGQFRGHERMHRAVHGPASQQIHATAPEFSCARTRQDEARRRRFLQDGVNNREKLGDPLDLVDHYRSLPGRACEQLPKALGTGSQAAMQRRFEQVQIEGIGKLVAQPSGLAGSARTEQEAALVRNLEESTYKFHYGSQNGNWNSDFRPNCDRRKVGNTAMQQVPHLNRTTAAASARSLSDDRLD